MLAGKAPLDSLDVAYDVTGKAAVVFVCIAGSDLIHRLLGLLALDTASDFGLKNNLAG